MVDDTLIKKIICIGGSLGGLEALYKILPKIPKHFQHPIVVVLHRYKHSDTYVSDSLSECVKVPICEIEDKQAIQKNHIYVAPAAYHTMVDSSGCFSLNVDECVNYSRPSIDVLFESVADVFQSKVIGVLLTGANSDGAKGISSIKAYGGNTIVQDPTTAESDIMPCAAIKTKRVDKVLTLEGIANALKEADDA